MAKSKFEYVRNFEVDDKCLPECFIVVRLDGRSFHKFSEKHDFIKPNDKRALELMSSCGKRVLKEYCDAIIAYGQSDEFSIVFKKDTAVYNRRSSKIMSCVCSLFTSTYVFEWSKFFPETPLKYPPSFDGRVILYPTLNTLRDYLSWRQADCHINNLYNTVFWSLVLTAGVTPQQAEERLKGTLAGDKNEILFSEFGINYNNVDELYRKGTIVYRKSKKDVTSKEAQNIITANCDIIREDFWEQNKNLL